VLEVSKVSGKGTGGGKVRLSQDIWGFNLQTLMQEFGEGEWSKLVEGDRN
jgi:hypothetical protein